MDPDNYYFTNSLPHHSTFVPTVTGSNSGKRIVRHRKELWVEDSPDPHYRKVTIRTLPDDALLEIFHLYVDGVDIYPRYLDRWRTLVQVCQRWRNVVFASPRRLNLHLVCKYRRPVKQMSNIWPELPIVVEGNGDPTVEEADNIVVALELTDRVTRIFLEGVPSSALERFAAVMQVPFPVLRSLDLWGKWDDAVPVISDGFLGGSAPHLQHLVLYGIPFPALPKLLLSATNLCYLYLWNIPHSGYISPKEMVTCLSTLIGLSELSLGFRSPRSRPSKASRPPRLSTRLVLPSLTFFKFRGVTEYLEDLVARIDVPSLEHISITFFNQLLFDIPQLSKFVHRIDNFAGLDRAKVVFHNAVVIVLSSRSGRVDPGIVELGISGSKLEWQLSSLPRVCSSVFSTLSNVEYLYISESHYRPPEWQDDIENSQWLELLQPFTTVKDMRISDEVISRLAPALQELSGEQATEVLPALQNLHLDGPQAPGHVQEGIGQFVAARQLSGQPVAVSTSRKELSRK